MKTTTPLIIGKEVIIKCGGKNKFMVTTMTSNDFLNLSKFQENFHTKRQFCDDKVTPLRFSKVICFLFRAEKPFLMDIKHRMGAAFCTVSLKKRGRLTNATIHLKYSESNKVSKKKLDGIKTLFRFIPPVYDEYYNRLMPCDTDAEEDIV